MSTNKKGLFITDDGRNLVVTFALVSSLFLLWGLCNGMIDVMDKHFQDELHLSKSQSAWVQFAHYLGYFLMAMPAGWLATEVGLQGRHHRGIADGRRGRVLVHTSHAYRVLLGLPARRVRHCRRLDLPGDRRQSLHDGARADPRYAATRINLAQSCNGIGWIFGPIIGAHVLLLQGCPGSEHGQPDPLYSLRDRRGRRPRAGRHLLLCQHARYQDEGRLPPG